MYAVQIQENFHMTLPWSFHWFPLSVSFQTYSAVVANTGCLPASIVAAGVALVQLEAVMFIPAHVEKRDTKRPLTCQDEPQTAVTESQNPTVLLHKN